MPDEEYLTVNEVAERLKINPETVRVWIRESKIRATNLGARRAGYRIPKSEVQRILQGGE
jgi:excisionase family DNA binding protein